jgi:hypothetical protein
VGDGGRLVLLLEARADLLGGPDRRTFRECGRTVLPLGARCQRLGGWLQPTAVVTGCCSTTGTGRRWTRAVVQATIWLPWVGGA